MRSVSFSEAGNVSASGMGLELSVRISEQRIYEQIAKLNRGLKELKTNLTEVREKLGLGAGGGIKYCEECGHQIEPPGKFCSSCGKRLL